MIFFRENIPKSLHITELCQSCYYQLRQIRTVRHSRHLPSKPWSMLSSASESISQTAFSTGQVPTFSTISSRSSILPHVWSSELANTTRSRLQYDETSTGSQSSIVFSSSSTLSRATAWLVMHLSTWSSSATPWTTFQQGATFGRPPRFSSWFLDIGRNAPVAEVSPSPHHSCGIYFLPTSGFSITSVNSSERDLKLTTCNSPR